MNFTKLNLATYLIITIIFFFATPYNIFWTVQDNLSIDEHMENIQHGNMYRKIALISLFLFTIFNNIIRKNMYKLKIDRTFSIMIIIFLVWIYLSIIWSDNRILTVRRLGVFSTLSFSAFFISRKNNYLEIITLTFCLCGFTLFLSIFTEIWLGNFKPFQLQYRFAGVMHPNFQGLNCAILLIASLCCYLFAKKNRKRYLYVAILSIGFLILTKSRAAIGSSMIAIFMLFWRSDLYNRKGYPFISTIALIGSIVFIFIIIFIPKDFLFVFKNISLIGREYESTMPLTGRIPLWIDLIESFFERPLTGFGYDSYWSSINLEKISKGQDWNVVSSHSSYFDILLGLGIIGFISFIGIYFISLKKSILAFKKTQNIGLLFTEAILVWISINMLFESILFQPNFPTFLFMILIAKLVFINENQRIKIKDR
jgi:exopolysaccharide production protein ExoQ